MALPGETVRLGAPHPYEDAMPKIMQSAAGFYVGYSCEDGSPYSRESGYYPSREAVVEAMLKGAISWR
jgi:hypothetical protein